MASIHADFFRGEPSRWHGDSGSSSASSVLPQILSGTSTNTTRNTTPEITTTPERWELQHTDGNVAIHISNTPNTRSTGEWLVRSGSRTTEFRLYPSDEGRDPHGNRRSRLGGVIDNDPVNLAQALNTIRKLEWKVKALLGQMTDLKRGLENAGEQPKHNQEEVKTIQEELKHTQEKLKNSQEEVKTIQEELNHTQETLEKSQEEVKTTQETLENSQEEVKITQEELKHTQETLENSQEEVKTIQEELKHTREILVNSREEVRTTREELKHAREILENSQEEVKTTQEEVKTIQEELKRTQEKLKHTRETLENSQEGVKTTQKELQDTEKKLKKTQEKLNTKDQHRKLAEKKCIATAVANNRLRTGIDHVISDIWHGPEADPLQNDSNLEKIDGEEGLNDLIKAVEQEANEMKKEDEQKLNSLREACERMLDETNQLKQQKETLIQENTNIQQQNKVLSEEVDQLTEANIELRRQNNTHLRGINFLRKRIGYLARKRHQLQRQIIRVTRELDRQYGRNAVLTGELIDEKDKNGWIEALEEAHARAEDENLALRKHHPTARRKDEQLQGQCTKHSLVRSKRKLGDVHIMEVGPDGQSRKTAFDQFAGQNPGTTAARTAQYVKIALR